MKLIYNKIFLEHETGDHPENKERLVSIARELKIQETPLEEFGDLQELKKLAELTHDKSHIDNVKKRCENGSGMFDLDTAFSKESYKTALYVIGASVLASEKQGFAIVRPPGHHAYQNKAGGFCIFNNIAIAVKKLIDIGKKVMIIDIDGHLGDGTEYIFYDSPQVLYLSLHQYPAYPGKGIAEQVGTEKGEGYSINFPLPPGTSDDIYLDAFEKVIKVGKEFAPDIVAISAGFDSYKDDMLLDLNLSYNSYYDVGKKIKENFSEIFAVLEGGYNIDKLPGCVQSFLDGVNYQEGGKQTYREKRTVSEKSIWNEYNERMDNLKKVLSKYWKNI